MMIQTIQKILLPALFYATCSLAGDVPGNSAIVPKPRDEWMQAHNSFVATAAKGQAGLVFLGDSITAGWNSAGRELWNSRYASRQAVNFGIGGDRTENVLWRIQNGELEGINPKAVVLLIGTNNFKTGNTSAQIAEGISAIVAEARKRLPHTKVLVVGILPRGDKPDSAFRRAIAEVNETVAKLEDGKQVYFLDPGARFLQPDGSISAQIMPDFLHLSPAGYKIYSDALEEKLPALIGP